LRSIELTYPHTFRLEELPETVCAIGFFDGVHEGHQKLIQTAVNKARENHMESAVITFHPHPKTVLGKSSAPVKYITSLKAKQELFRKMDVDRLYIIKFDQTFSQLAPQDFIDQFIIGLNIKHLVAGYDYSYGHKGKGNMSNIDEYARGAFTYTVIDQISKNGEKVSSTRIRDLLCTGNIEKANELLGRPFCLKGNVIHGEERGREIGYPTANLDVDSQLLLPKIGVYAVKVFYKNEEYEGMANIGTNPTFTEDARDVSVEVNIFDYNNDLYGEEIMIEWYKYMRPEEKYESADALIRQMAQDEKNIRAYFEI